MVKRVTGCVTLSRFGSRWFPEVAGGQEAGLTEIPQTQIREAELKRAKFVIK